MKQLDEREPLMYRHMWRGGVVVVRRSASRIFNCVPTDQAQEQTISREAKSQVCVICFTLRKGALLRWLMTRHITGEYAEAFTKGFWEPMQKCTMSTFADMKKALPNDKDRKLIIDSEVLFRRLLGVSKSRDVDLRKVLQYELAAVPSLGVELCDHCFRSL